jgi:hypothetical protein
VAVVEAEEVVVVVVELPLLLLLLLLLLLHLELLRWGPNQESPGRHPLTAFSSQPLLGANASYRK